MIVAADFGGTTIKLGLVETGRLAAWTRLEACADRPMSERLEAAACGWESLLKADGKSLRDCAGAALALPFLVDPIQFRVRGDFQKFPGAAEIDFGSWGRKRLGLPVAMDGDARVALLGEWAAGAARGKRHAAILTLGTGIGCAALCDGRLLRGAHHAAAVLFGHSTVAHEGPKGRCGNPGCAEDLASTATLGQRARARKDFAGSALAAAGKIDFETLCRLAVEGDGCARALLEQSLDVWAALARNAVLAYDPEVIVLGGGVLRHPGIVPALRERMTAFFSPPPEIVAAALGDNAALLGGEILFHPSRLSLSA